MSTDDSVSNEVVHVQFPRDWLNILCLERLVWTGDVLRHSDFVMHAPIDRSRSIVLTSHNRILIANMADDVARVYNLVSLDFSLQLPSF